MGYYGNMSRSEAQELLGCTWQEATEYLTKQLLPGQTLKCMTIDHIRPFASASKHDIQAMREICHYTNLQVMTRTENLSKGPKQLAVLCSGE